MSNATATSIGPSTRTTIIKIAPEQNKNSKNTKNERQKNGEVRKEVHTSKENRNSIQQKCQESQREEQQQQPQEQHQNARKGQLLGPAAAAAAAAPNSKHTQNIQGPDHEKEKTPQTNLRFVQGRQPRLHHHQERSKTQRCS